MLETKLLLVFPLLLASTVGAAEDLERTLSYSGNSNVRNQSPALRPSLSRTALRPGMRPTIPPPVFVPAPSKEASQPTSKSSPSDILKIQSMDETEPTVNTTPVNTTYITPSKLTQASRLKSLLTQRNPPATPTTSSILSLNTIKPKANAISTDLTTESLIIIYPAANSSPEPLTASTAQSPPTESVLRSKLIPQSQRFPTLATQPIPIPSMELMISQPQQPPLELPLIQTRLSSLSATPPKTESVYLPLTTPDPQPNSSSQLKNKFTQLLAPKLQPVSSLVPVPRTESQPASTPVREQEPIPMLDSQLKPITLPEPLSEPDPFLVPVMQPELPEPMPQLQPTPIPVAQPGIIPVPDLQPEPIPIPEPVPQANPVPTLVEQSALQSPAPEPAPVSQPPSVLQLEPEPDSQSLSPPEIILLPTTKPLPQPADLLTTSEDTITNPTTTSPSTSYTTMNLNSSPAPTIPNQTTSKYVQEDTSICKKRNAYYSVANECVEYVECRKSSPEKRMCPDGLHFNPNAVWPAYPCGYPFEVPCANGTNRPPAKPTAECPRQYGYYPMNDGDCSKYLMCQEGKAKIMDCPLGLVFNPDVNSCDWAVNVPKCNPNAFKNFVCPSWEDGVRSEVISKYRYFNSCDKYVACQRGYPRLLTCDFGLFFDESSQACINKDNVTDCDGP